MKMHIHLILHIHLIHENAHSQHAAFSTDAMAQKNTSNFFAAQPLKTPAVHDGEIVDTVQGMGINPSLSLTRV